MQTVTNIFVSSEIALFVETQIRNKEDLWEVLNKFKDKPISLQSRRTKNLEPTPAVLFDALRVASKFPDLQVHTRRDQCQPRDRHSNATEAYLKKVTRLNSTDM